MPSVDHPQGWTEIWKLGQESFQNYHEYMQSLPSCVRVRNDPRRCRLDHLSRGEEDLFLDKGHCMRSIEMKCVSSDCGLGGGICPRRYKILVCEQSDLAIIYMKYEHLIPGVASSPKKPRLTTQMKNCLDEKLSENAALKPEDLFSLLASKVQRGQMEGPNPTKSQVQGYIKRWRSVNKQDFMQPVIDICSQSMYDTLENIDETGDNLIVFCDSKLVDNQIIPDIGNGDESSPFRIGLTSFSLLNSYASLQENDRISTVVHVDSTHNIVRKKYPVFVIGFSDVCGQFFPIVYCCTSQRREKDISWILSYLKRAYLEKFSISFAPRFVMSDADDAQFNACQQQLPHTKLLMCWFHVAQNAKKHCKGLPAITTKMVFRDLNNLHFCTTEQEYVDKRDRILCAWKSAAEFYQPFRSVYQRLKTEWMVDGRGRPSRFSCWQIYHTPTGCASTNNPVETYHKTLKLVNKSSSVSPTELVDRLDKSRIGFLGSNKNVKFVPEVSKRLRALYTRQVKYGELRAVPLERVGSTNCVRILHRIPRLHHYESQTQQTDLDDEDTADLYFEGRNLPFRSRNILRMQWRGIPSNGWLVNATTRECGCRFFEKFGICVHVIHATKAVSLPCPGMPDPERRFVFASSRSNSRRNHRINRQQHTEVIHLPTMNEFIPHGSILYGPHEQENRNGLSYNDDSAQFQNSALDNTASRDSEFSDTNFTGFDFFANPVTIEAATMTNNTIPNNTNNSNCVYANQMNTTTYIDYERNVHDETTLHHTISRSSAHTTISRESCEHTKRRRL